MATPRPTAYKATQAYQQAAWRSPGDARFDSRPANDWSVDEKAVAVEAVEEGGGVPGWLIVVAGAIVVSMLAVFAANAMAI